MYTKQILQSPTRPTEIFATNNFLAIGAMCALREFRVRVPKDVSLVVFDDLPAAITIDPFFTVAAQPAYEKRNQATELLLTRLSEESLQSYQEIIVQVEIVVRRSSNQWC